LGLLIFLIMTTWRTGIDALRACLMRSEQEPGQLLADLEAGRIPRVPGTAVFLTRSAEKCPRLLIEHVEHMGALQQNVVALRVVFKDIPRVAEGERWTIEPLVAGIWHAVICFGFVEIPDLSAALRAIKDLDASIDLEHAVYFATRDQVIRKPGSTVLGHGRLMLFAFLYRNAVKVVDRFHLPAQNVVEIARLLAI
jgi:KUP system potassium uptake protein